jgi:light-harvesting complex 1 beta chain
MKEHMHERCELASVGPSNPSAWPRVNLLRCQSLNSPSWIRKGSGNCRKAFLKEAQTMTDAANPSGLTDEEAQEFHTYFIQGYLLWAVGAFFAHSLVWIWRPWF